MEKEEKIAEFIGAMLGDGNVGIYKCKAGAKIKIQHRVKITLDSRNKQYIEHISKLMREVLETEPRIFFKKNENAVDIATFKKEKFFYVVNNLGLQVSPKWNSMKIPETYSKGKLSLLVLRGLFDTDGSVTIFKNNGNDYPRIEIRICPCPAQNQILEILKENNFSYKVQNLERGKIKVRISGKNELKKWFEKVGSSNKRHTERATPFLE